ncbi:unnamed protein product [Phytomonas sp. Hart1]|nr:unnamed protein product [Phytomonas sp. Hart1]|eukprot:CCW69409.1 unnamed protein product [Phytomonas sp. isolate Hart1]
MALCKNKNLDNAPVYRMPHEQQVHLLSNALLREFMHRRGFLDTLKTFDQENPRDADTISSRALMSDLMDLDAMNQKRLKSMGIETIMEMLCALRVEHRQEMNQLTEEANADVPEAPSEDELEELRKMYRRRKKEVRQALKAKKMSVSDPNSSKDGVLPKEKYTKGFNSDEGVATPLDDSPNNSEGDCSNDFDGH